MNPLPSHTRLKSLYNKYLYLDDKAYYDKKRFFEKNELEIANMKLADAIWIEEGYLDALYMTNDYGKFCKRSQKFLEKLIYHNISYFNEEQLFEKILHRRAVSYYRLRQYENSIHNAKELIKINPDRKDTRKVLFYAIRSSHKKTLKIIKAGFIVFFLSSSMMLLFHQIIILSFFGELNEWYLKLILWICGPTFLVLLMTKVSIDIKSYLAVNSFCSKKK